MYAGVRLACLRGCQLVNTGHGISTFRMDTHVASMASVYTDLFFS
jgi:hypothetical protein